MQLVTQRLAAQLAIYHHIANFRREQDDQPAIKEVSRCINDVACRQLTSNPAKLKRIIVDGSHERWADTVVSFGKLTLPDELTAKFNAIAHCVATVFEQTFPGRRFEIKIYLKMDFPVPIDGKETTVNVLTSVARYPVSLEQGSGVHGKSWISCLQGRKADVWDAFDSRSVRVYKCVRAADENRIYQTIACIPMLNKVGVITVEADERSTFLSPEDTSEDREEIEAADQRTPVFNHIVSPDLSVSVASAVKELVVRAIRSDASLGTRT